MSSFFGEYRHKVDAKGRLSLPSAFRKLVTVDTQLVVAPDVTKKSLWVFSEQAYENWVDTLFEKRGGYNPGNSDHVGLRRMLNAQARSIAMDAAGRINISADQRETTHIDKDVVLVGNADHFEIWDVALWEQEFSAIDLESLLFNS